jgi:hypothetical protein
MTHEDLHSQLDEFCSLAQAATPHPQHLEQAEKQLEQVMHWVQQVAATLDPASKKVWQDKVQAKLNAVVQSIPAEFRPTPVR